MAHAEHIRKVVGIRIDLTTEEALALVHTAKRVRDVVDTSKGWEALCAAFTDSGASAESKLFIHVVNLMWRIMQDAKDDGD